MAVSTDKITKKISVKNTEAFSFVVFATEGNRRIFVGLFGKI
jgi:hypothetical protein